MIQLLARMMSTTKRLNTSLKDPNDALLTLLNKQASSFFNENLTNADNNNSMNVSTKMDMSLVNKPAIQRVNCAIRRNIHTYTTR